LPSGRLWMWATSFRCFMTCSRNGRRHDAQTSFGRQCLVLRADRRL
jgi:hypothetical protein